MAGYSGTPLLKKLGIKPGNRILLLDSPPGFPELLGPLPEGVTVAKDASSGQLDYLHWFTDSAHDLAATMPQLKDLIHPNGMIWISWPKKASGVKTDVNGNLVRETGLKTGLVDVKVCAIDETWSGLKFVYRKSDR